MTDHSGVSSNTVNYLSTLFPFISAHGLQIRPFGMNIQSDQVFESKMNLNEADYDWQLLCLKNI